MNPLNLSNRVKLVLFELLCHCNMSLKEALGDYDFVTNLVSRIFKDNGADSGAKKINCVRATRSCMGLGPREAMEFTERFQRRMVDYNSFVEACDRSFRHGDYIEPAVLKNMVDEATSYDDVDIPSLKSEIIDFIHDIPF